MKLGDDVDLEQVLHSVFTRVFDYMPFWGHCFLSNVNVSVVTVMPENCLKHVECSSHILLKVIGERFGASCAKGG